jgi:hypothetical protein
MDLASGSSGVIVLASLDALSSLTPVPHLLPTQPTCTQKSTSRVFSSTNRSFNVTTMARMQNYGTCGDLGINDVPPANRPTAKAGPTT